MVVDMSSAPELWLEESEPGGARRRYGTGCVPARATARLPRGPRPAGVPVGRVARTVRFSGAVSRRTLDSPGGRVTGGNNRVGWNRLCRINERPDRLRQA